MAQVINEFNQRVIDDFRAHGGKVGPPFDQSSVLLLHTTGARSGEERIHPVVYRNDGDRLVIFASKAGAPDNPAWYNNLVAHPQVRVEVGERTLDAVARVATGAERERLWTAQKTDVPGFAEYEAKTTRQIPVVILEPVA